MLIQLNNEIIRLLQKNGWSENRDCSIEKWTEELEKEGFSSFAIAENILRSFGGLTITPLQGEGCEFFSEIITFDPFSEDSATFEDLKMWEDDFELKLYPLGLTVDGIRILISIDEGIYGATSDMFFRYGNSLQEGLECLFLANKAPEVLSD